MAEYVCDCLLSYFVLLEIRKALEFVTLIVMGR